MPTKDHGQIEGRQFERRFNFVFFPDLLYPWKSFIKLWSNVRRSEMICITYDSICCLRVKIAIEGLEFEP